MSGIPRLRGLALWVQSGWRDFVRGHTVGQRRDLAFVGPFPFLLIMRGAMWAAAVARFLLDKRGGVGVLLSLGAMGALFFLAIPVTYRHRKWNHDYWQLPFVVCDSLIFTYLVWWAAVPHSDVFLCYMLPLLTVGECLGGWSTLITYGGISFLYGSALLFLGRNPVIVVVYLTRELYLAFFAVLTLVLFQVTSRSLGDVHLALRKINDSNADWVKLDTELDALLQEVKNLGFEFVSLSTVDPYQRLAIMTKALNIPAGWMRRSRRPIDGADIMADVLRSGRVETPRYDDPRFEPSTYRLFKHEQLARVYVPVFKDKDTPVGVVQAGWERQHKGDVIPEELVARLVPLVEKRGELIVRARPHVFLEELCQIVLDALPACDAVTLHVYEDDRFLWAAHAGTFTDAYVAKLQHLSGVMDAALRGKAEWTDVAGDLRRCYPDLYSGGGRSFAAIPLNAGPEAKGALSVLFEREQRFGKWMREQIRLLGRGVESAIQTRLLLVDSALRSSRVWTQSRLSTVEDALQAKAPLKEVLQRIAEHFLYNLDADCVTLYEYRPDSRDFGVPPVRAGEFLDPPALTGSIMAGNLLWRCLDKSSEFYRELPAEFREARQDGSAALRFTDREKIQSCAVLVLETQDSGEKAGLIFVNYRRRISFSPEMRVAMATLASSASMVIRTARQIEQRRRTVESMQRIEQVIAGSGGPPDLDLILQDVLRSACELTGAPQGRIVWFTPNGMGLEYRTAHGCELPARRQVEAHPLEVVNQVLRERRFIVVPAIGETGPCLAVPLRASHLILGVVLLEGNAHQRFAGEDALTVETLGVLAAVGASFTDLYRPLLALGAVAARLQEQPFDLDTALRIILTGVTAGEGLGFTRAMVFLTHGKADQARGRLAIGPLSREEAHSTWEDIEVRKGDPRSPDFDRFAWLLDQAQESSRRIRDGADDSALSRHIQAISVPASLWESNNRRYDDASVGDLTREGDWTGELACAPLVVKDAYRGFLLADRNFQPVEVTASDIRLLRLFADIAAIMVENLTVRPAKSADERLEQWRHLFSEARHEVGTRLAYLDGYVRWIGSDLVSSGADSTEWDAFLRQVRHRISCATWMAKKVQPWQGELLTLTEKIDLIDLAWGVVTEARLICGSGGIEFDPGFDAPCKLVLECDPLDLEGAFLELLKNAVDAIHRNPGGSGNIKVEVRVEDPGGDALQEAIVRVIDEGPGIPLAQREKIFEAQYTTKDGPGHGYGLVGAKRRIEALGGTIRVTGPEGRGACFEIRLPVKLGRQP